MPYPWAMVEYRLCQVTGTRDEIVQELMNGSVGWQHVGRNDLADQARKAAIELSEGGSDVWVGHIAYHVTAE